MATFTRSDYSSCMPVMRAIEADPDLQLHVLVGGMHLSPEFGNTVKEIEADGFAIQDRIEMLQSADTAQAIAEAIGLGTMGLASSFTRLKPDILVIVGDRFELMAAAAAAVSFGLPLAHISGGDVTEGALDNQVRHAITKLSHLHFVSMEEHAIRLRQMGEENWRVFVTGDPALDSLREMRLLSREELGTALGMELDPPVVVVTYHPTTLGTVSPEEEVDCLLDVLAPLEATFVLTYPNADPGNRVIIESITQFASSRPRAKCYNSVGQLQYYSLLSHADLMVGNSSSGIWEAPSFRLPAVNVGDRQRGRLRAGNVIDTQVDAQSIAAAVDRALTVDFRASLSGIVNPYGDGHAAERICGVLKEVAIDSRLLQKSFVDLKPLPAVLSKTRGPGCEDPAALRGQKHRPTLDE